MVNVASTENRCIVEYEIHTSRTVKRLFKRYGSFKSSNSIYVSPCRIVFILVELKTITLDLIAINI